MKLNLQLSGVSANGINSNWGILNKAAQRMVSVDEPVKRILFGAPDGTSWPLSVANGGDFGFARKATTETISGAWTFTTTVTGTVFDGVATSAQYADLAERYEADAVYAPGTVMVFDGIKEVTQSTARGQTNIAGVISTDPAFRMNEAAGTDETHPMIALTGRVPCKVVGKIRRHDRLITSWVPGVATSMSAKLLAPYTLIGFALEAYDSDEPGLIEIAVRRG